MSIWLRLAVFGLRLLGLTDMAEKLFNSYMDKQAGRKQQQADDALAALKVSEAMREAPAPKTKHELEDMLRNGKL